MAFKLLLAAEGRWRGVNAPHLGALVKAGVRFPNGQAEMFQPEESGTDLFSQTLSMFAAEEVDPQHLTVSLICVQTIGRILDEGMRRLDK